VDDYLTLPQAAALLGVSRWTLQRRIREARLALYTAGADHRRRLLRRDDVERLAARRPVAPDRRAAGEGGRR
jgi:excisionase family DNA binding protein